MSGMAAQACAALQHVELLCTNGTFRAKWARTKGTGRQCHTRPQRPPGKSAQWTHPVRESSSPAGSLRHSVKTKTYSTQAAPKQQAARRKGILERPPGPSTSAGIPGCRLPGMERRHPRQRSVLL